jgi:hypothetical protein
LGQVVPAGGFEIPKASEPMKSFAALKTLDPIIQKFAVSPSFG